jgi:hypothetical protein
VNLSGGGFEKEDVILWEELRAEVKYRRSGWKTLRKYLGKANVLALMSPGEEPLIVLRAHTWRDGMPRAVELSVSRRVDS